MIDLIYRWILSQDLDTNTEYCQVLQDESNFNDNVYFKFKINNKGEIENLVIISLNEYLNFINSL